MKRQNYLKITLLFLGMILTASIYSSLNGHVLTSDLGAVIGLPEDLHPKYSPDINVSAGDSKQPIETIYANVILQFLAGGLLYLAGPVAVLVIAIAGLRYATSHGNESMMEGAKKTLTYAVIGLVVIILSFAIIRGIISVLTTTS